MCGVSIFSVHVLSTSTVLAVDQDDEVGMVSVYSLGAEISIQAALLASGRPE